MNLRTLLQAGSARANELFARLSETSDGAVKTRERLFPELRAELEQYAGLEEQHLFPILRRNPETRGLVADAVRDNRELRAKLAELDGMAKDDEAFPERLRELQKAFRQHARDERRELLPAVRRALSGEQVQGVAERIEAGLAEAGQARQDEAEERRANARRERVEAEQEAAEAERARRVEVAARQGSARHEREGVERRCEAGRRADGAAVVARLQPTATEAHVSTDPRDLDRDLDGCLSKSLPLLSLPPDLSSKKFLNVYCGNGFFCHEAKKRGAQVVIGVDSDTKAIEDARRRFPDLDFRHRAGLQLPDGKYDVILMILESHQEPDLRLLGRICQRLASKGLFILEAAAVSQAEKCWIEASEGGRNVLVPTVNLLVEDLLIDYSVRKIGMRNPLNGGSVPRHVFHCRKFQPIVLVVPGASGIGKTTLARELSRLGIVTYSTDHLLGRVAANSFRAQGEIYDFIKNRYNINAMDVLTRNIADAGLSEPFADLLFRYMPKSGRVTVVEGFSLSPPAIHQAFVGRLNAAKLKVWSLSPS